MSDDVRPRGAGGGEGAKQTHLKSRSISPDIRTLLGELPLEGAQQLQVAHGGHPDAPPQVLVELFADGFYGLMDHPDMHSSQ